MVTVAEAMAQELARAGVDRVFGLPGGEVLHLIDAFRRHEIQFVLCRHEANAGIAAAVYGKLKRKPGVVLTTLGPGAANLMLPLTNSLLDREPLVAISAQIPESWPASHTHQRIPLVDCYKPITKYASPMNPYTARRTIRRALEAAFEAPAGPTYVTVSAETATASCLEPEAEVGTGSPGASPHLVSAPEQAADELRQLLAAAERPLVLFGIGIDPAHAEKVRRWLTSWDLAAGVTPKIKGLVDETDDYFVGVFGGMSLDGLMVEALEAADLIVGFGFDPVEVDKTWHAHLPITWVLDAPLAMDVVPRSDLICGPFAEILDELIAAGPPKRWGDPFRSFKAKRAAHLAESDPGEPRLRQNPVAIVRALAEVMPQETIVTTDVGSHKYVFGQFWPSRQPETFLMSNGLSGMGYGLAAALGAKLARPESPVLAAVGDGGFSMNSQELETAVRYDAPLVVVVLADASYSLIHHSQQNKGLPNYGVDFDPIDSVGTAEACGVAALRVESGLELATAVEEALMQQTSLVVEVPVTIEAYAKLV